MHLSLLGAESHMGPFNDRAKASFHATSGHFSFVCFSTALLSNDQIWISFGIGSGRLLFWSEQHLFPRPWETAARCSFGRTTPLHCRRCRSIKGEGRDLRLKLGQSDSSGNFNHKRNNIRSENNSRPARHHLFLLETAHCRGSAALGVRAVERL